MKLQKKKEWESIKNIIKPNICEIRRHRISIECCWKRGVGGKGVMEGFEQIKVKYTDSGDTLRHTFEHQFRY
jgi:hypothetical protein